MDISWDFVSKLHLDRCKSGICGELLHIIAHYFSLFVFLVSIFLLGNKYCIGGCV